MAELKELAKAAGQAYGLGKPKLTLIDPKDEVYKLESKAGTFALKKNKYPKDEFLYIYYGMEHLAENRFKSLNRVLLTQNRSPLLSFSGATYFLSNWLPGRAADYKKERDVRLVGQALAKLHKAGFGYQPFYYEGRIKWGQNLQIIQNKIADLTRWQELAESNPQPCFFDLLYKKNIPHYLACLQEARQTMFPVFKAVDNLAFKQGSFCHHDLAAHNILVKGNKINFIDFDYAVSDTTCHDVASLLLRILKENDYGVSLSKKALHAYEKELPVTFAQLQMILGFMKVPQSFWQLGLTYYEEEQFFIPANAAANNLRFAKLEARLNSTLAKRMKREKAIKQLEASWEIC